MPRRLRLTARALIRRPVFSLVVILTLALGLGADTALFSVVDAVLLSPPPYPQPDRLMRVWETTQREVIERRAFSYPDFLDLRAQVAGFSTLVAVDPAAVTWNAPGGAERLTAELASPGYFSLLGAEPTLGRGFLPEAEAGREGAPTSAGGPREVVVSQRFRRERLGGGDVLGRILVLDGDPYQVVGVAPEGFRGLSDEAWLWLSVPQVSVSYLDDRGSRWLGVVGRLASGVPIERAQEEVSTIFRRLAADHPRSNARYGGLVTPLTEDLLGDLRRPLWVLLAAVGCVLLIACANVANLLLVRAAGRRRETALRAVLGAGRGSLLRQGVSEAVLLSLAGGALGLALAAAGVRALTALAPVELPSYIRPGVDLRVLLFSLALALATGVALGLVTSLRASSPPPAEVLRSEAGRGVSRRQPLRSLLLAAEVALALVLAIGAGLMIRSWQRVAELDLGYRPQGVAVFRAALPAPPPAAGEERQARMRRHRETLAARILDTLRRLPGVESAALATGAPLDGYNAMVVSREGDPGDPDEPYGGGYRIYRHEVSPDYFETLGIALLHGRLFTETDRWDAPAVAVAGRSAAERLWPGRDPVGQRFKLGVPADPRAEDAGEIEWVTVVGVVDDVAQRTVLPDPVGSPDDPDLYFSLAQLPAGTLTGLVRTAGDPEALLPALRREVSALDPGMPVYDLGTLAGRVADDTARTRFSTWLLGLFALLALVLAAVGIYGMVSIQVVERVREIGIRMALGADRGRVVRQVVLGSMAGVGVGTVIGLGLSLALTRVLEGLLFEVSATDPATFVRTTAVLLGVALLASLLPARHASRVDPAVALRRE